MKDLIRQILIEERKPKGYWDNEINIEKVAKDCKTRTEFQDRYQMAYKKALEINKTKPGFFERITNHMPKPKSESPYTEQELTDIASSANTKTEFMTKFPGAYQVALRMDKVKPGFFDKITSHMLSLGSKHKRMVYGYFFPKNNAVYVGLTYNINERNKQHLIIDVDEKKQTTVAKFINETQENPELVKFTDYIDVQEAQKKEGEYVNKFKSEYLILNKVKTGGLGHGLKYTDEELKDLLSNIFDYKDLYTKHYPLYTSAKRRGRIFLNDATSHMIKIQKNRINWSKDLVKQYAKDYKSKDEFRTAFRSAAKYAKEHGFWDELFPKEIPSPEEIIKVASEYNTQNDFRINHPTLYNHAKNLGLLPKIIFKKSKKRGPSLTPDDVINISQNYNTRKDFYQNENSAYRRAMVFCEKLGNDFCVKVFGHLL
jgi:predicted GIY-YIG superfamily endonuclease